MVKQNLSSLAQDISLRGLDLFVWALVKVASPAGAFDRLFRNDSDCALIRASGHVGIGP